jgi:hypothetical protein
MAYTLGEAVERAITRHQRHLAAAVTAADTTAAAARSEPTSRVSAETRPSPLCPGPPKARTVTGWIMTRPGEPVGADRASLNAILVVHR